MKTNSGLYDNTVAVNLILATFALNIAVNVYTKNVPAMANALACIWFVWVAKQDTK